MKTRIVNVDQFLADDNNGGNYILLEKVPGDDSVVHLEVGFCCVTVINCTVPVTFIAAAIDKAAGVGPQGVQDFIKELGFDQKFTDELVSKVK